MRHIVICGLPMFTMFFPHYLINGIIFKIHLLDMKYVFRCFLQLLSETFLILRGNERDVILKCIGLHENYILFFPFFN